MDGRITKEQLKKALAADLEKLLEAAVEAVNQAQPGHIIDDSEEPVRDAAGVFRQKLFEKALELRSQREAFSPQASPDDQPLAWRNKGTQAIHVTTVNGSISICRRVYWTRSQGCYAPLDAWLGLSSRYSQGVREMVCRVGLDGSYRKAAEDLHRLGQITLSYQTLRDLFQGEGQKVRTATTQGDLMPTFTAQDCHVRADEPTCLITGADGFQVPRITDAEQRKRRTKAKQRRRHLRQQGHSLPPLPPRPVGSDQKWKEVKLVTFYDPSGRHRHTAATTGNHQAAGRLMRSLGARLHLNQADHKYSVSDGAEWIRCQYQQQLPMLDARILDYYHFRDHTIACAQSVFGEGTDAASQWREAFCTTMLRSGPVQALTDLALLGSKRRGGKRQAILALQGYIARHTDMLDYPRYLAHGYQTGSGPTESQCKSLAGRLKGCGRRWNRRGIDAHLALSALYTNSGQWTVYWPKVPMP